MSPWQVPPGAMRRTCKKAAVRICRLCAVRRQRSSMRLVANWYQSVPTVRPRASARCSGMRWSRPANDAGPTQASAPTTARGALPTNSNSRFLAGSAHRARRHLPGAHAAAVGPSVRLHCGARAGVAPITHFAPIPSGLALRSDSIGESVHEARCARRPRRCAPRRRRNRPCQVPPVAGRGRACFRSHTPSAATKPGPGRLRCASEAPRSAGPVASARSAPRALTSSRLSERSARRARSELATRPWDRAPQGSRRSRPPRRSVAACPGPALLARKAACGIRLCAVNSPRLLGL